MCGIAGIVNIDLTKIERLTSNLKAMNKIIAHRGPDGEGYWINDGNSVGFVHRRLSIIDLSEFANQPMISENGLVIVFNGEIYNYLELRDQLVNDWAFRTKSDTECILAAYAKYGESCVDHLRGMFSFVIWDEKNKKIFCARDRFGIKPFYYCIVNNIFYFASEAKALLPFLPEITTNKHALAEYLTFQYCIGDKTLFEGIRQLLPSNVLSIANSNISIRKYWDTRYEVDFDHSPTYFSKHLRELLDESLNLHLRSDVPIGNYLSGGLDSSLIYLLSNRTSDNSKGFHGRFREYAGYDESRYAKIAAEHGKGNLYIQDITSDDFRKYLRSVIYHLDFPVAGPGSFPQFMVSKLASQHRKVVLGGQGGDEIFGGYARYMIAYFEQCIKAAIDGSYNNGNYVVTIESIVPNLGLLQEYKPLIKDFWRKGLFDPMDERYFRLINRSTDMQDEIYWEDLNMTKVFEDFSVIFNNPNNVRKEAYFDKMTNFDFKCMLPALLQVEDRMSMAHGLESRVPFLDHPLVEFVATVPADVKFKNGTLKNLLKNEFGRDLPPEILNRRDKMGFPVPLKEWFDNDLKGFINEMFLNMSDKNRPFINGKSITKNIGTETKFSRKTWGLLSLELWHQEFHDQARMWKSKIE